MNTEKLQHIKSALRHAIDLADSATPGPWVIPSANVHRVIALEKEQPVRLIVEHPEEDAFFGKDNLSYFRLGDETGGDQSAVDKKFIAHARTFAPAAARALLVKIEENKSGEAAFRQWSGDSYEWDALTGLEQQRWNRLAEHNLSTICREWPEETK